MNGINQNIFTKSLSGLSDIYADDIMTTNITATNIYTSTGTNILSTTNDLQNQINDIVIYDTTNTATTNNLQTQINNILAYDITSATTINNLQNQVNNITSTSSSGGGYFTVVCERLGHNINNTFGFGAGQYNNNEIILPACTLKRSYITASQSLASGVTNFNIFKNGVSTSESVVMSTPSSSNTNTHNITFVEGDTFKIKTLSGGTYTSNSSVQIRINLIFECVGIKGADGISPTLTIGTVSTLPSSSDATITNTGTSTNQIINHGIPRGTQGLQGDIGITPSFIIGSVSNLASGNTPFVNFDNTSTTTNKILNFGLVQGQQGIQGNPGNDGITPSFIIGTVSNLASGNVPFINFDNTSTTTNKIMNFGLVQGEKGEKGDSIKGDKGDPGPAASAGDIGNAIGTSAVFIVLQGQVTVLQGQMATVQGQILTIDGTLTTHTGQIATLENEVGTHDQILSGIETKLYNVIKTPDALQVKSKFQIINSVMGGDIVLATFDPIGNTITTGTTGSINSMVGNTVNLGSLTTASNNVRGNVISIGNEAAPVTATTNIRGTTVSILGSTNNSGFSTTINNMRGSTLTIGNVPGGSFPATNNTNIRGTTITMGAAETTTINTGFTGTTTNNIKGNIINVGENLFSSAVNVQGTNISIGDAQQTTNVEIEANNIRIGTAGFLNNVYIGNVYSNVRIESMDNAAIGVGNFFDQINP